MGVKGITGMRNNQKKNKRRKLKKQASKTLQTTSDMQHIKPNEADTSNNDNTKNEELVTPVCSNKKRLEVKISLILVWFFASVYLVQATKDIHELYTDGCYTVNLKPYNLFRDCPGSGITFTLIVNCMIWMICFIIFIAPLIMRKSNCAGSSNTSNRIR